MSKRRFHRSFLIAATVFMSTAAFGQVDIQLRTRQLPGWDPRTREGRCEIRVWVDNRAEVRMRGDTIFVRTLEGSRGRDEGSECTQPLPFNSVSGFTVRQTAGRTRVSPAQEPSRMNNYTALITIDDPQGGGDNYAFEVTWRAASDVTAAPAPFFDDVRACQDSVRQRFMSQNGRGSYIDFNGFADRMVPGQQDRDRNQNPPQNRDFSRGRGQGRNNGPETIQGRGNARSSSESRDLTYSCSVDTRQNRVLTVAYQYSGNSMRLDGRNYGRQLR
jgi:hypothetical protein